VLKRATVIRRTGWGIADQAVSSLTNFALGLFVVRATTAAEFGAFGIAFVTYLLVLNLGRAIVAQPLLIHYSTADTPTWRSGTRAALAVALAVGLAAGAVCLVVGVLVGGDLRAAFVGLGLGLPGLLAQDAWRFAFFAAGRGRSAFVNDLVWALALVPIFAALVLADNRALLPIVVGWGTAASIAALVGFWQAHLAPDLGAIRAWFRTHEDLIPRFSAEVLARMGGSQAAYYIIGAVGGLGAVGAIRAADLILGPFNILFQGIHLVALPEGRRRLTASTAALVRWCLFLSVGIALGALVWGGICLLLPDAVGEALLGSTWTAARSVLAPMVAALTGLVASAGAVVGLRSLAAAGRTLRAAIVTSVATLIAATVGVFAGGAFGAALGLAIGSWIGAVAWWWELVAALGSYDPSQAADGGPQLPEPAP